MYTLYNDVVDANHFSTLYDNLISSKGWSYNGRSTKQDFLRIWYNDLQDDSYFTEVLFDQIKNKIGANYSLQQVYANGQTYGQSGSMHRDSIFPDTYTFLIYVNKLWRPEWGGHTIIQNNHGHYDSILPRPNTGLFFDSRLDHCGLEPTRFCMDLRITIAYKLKKVANDKETRSVT